MSRASCRPYRLTRFEDAHHAACDGLYRRAGALDDALAAYRAGCEHEYRVATVDAVSALDAWRGSYRAFATWVGDVGRAFLAADAVDAYVSGGGLPGADGLSSGTDEEVLAYLHERWADDPYLGVVDPVTGTIAADAAPWVADLVATDQDAPPPWVEAVDSGSYATLVLGEITRQTAAVLAGVPRAIDVVVRYEEATVVLLQNGTVVARVTRAEIGARVLVPRSTGGLGATARWLGRASTAATFVATGAEQWFGDDGLPVDERIARTLTRGGGVALGGWLGGAAGGATAGLVCGPGAPVCSGVLGIGGALVGALGADWLISRLPWMDDPEPLPLEYDLEAVEDLIADGGPEEGRAASLAAVDLLGRDTAEASAPPGSWEEHFLGQVLPERDALLDVVDPPPEAPTPGTTTTTTPPTTVPPPAPLPPTPSPTPAPTPSAPPTGTTVPSPGG